MEAFLLLSLTSASLATLVFPPEITRVVINIGSNLQPVLPPTQDQHTVAIAYEPIVGHRIPPRPNLFVVHAAVGNQASLAMMRSLNRDGLSSSLATPSMSMSWNKGPNRGSIYIVPVVPMRLVLESLPPQVSVWYLKTDMQGYDFDAIVGAGELLRKRVHYIKTEVWFHNVQTYEGVNNDFCLDHLPYMTRQGFEIAMVKGSAGTLVSAVAVDAFCAESKNKPRTAGLKEGDAYWRRANATESTHVPQMTIGPGDHEWMY